MRRTLSAVLLIFAMALPVCAQHWGSVPRGGGNFAHGGRNGVHIGGSVSFGHNPRFNVFVGSRRSFYRPHWSSRRYGYGYPYPYLYATPIIPVYPLAAYPEVPAYPIATDGYDSGATVVETPQPYYPYYPSDSVGLDQQMRQQQVGIYRPPVQPAAAAAPAQPAPAATPSPEPAPPAVLVYRDGRRAEVNNYAVVGQTLWIFSEQRARKVPLADLNLEATRTANAERGIDFAVPPPHVPSPR
jgi:hypothetical protein